MRNEGSTRGHVFVVMLAYMIIRRLRKAWESFDLTVKDGIEQGEDRGARHPLPENPTATRTISSVAGSVKNKVAGGVTKERHTCSHKKKTT